MADIIPRQATNTSTKGNTMSTPTFKNVGQAVNHFFTITDETSSEEVKHCARWVAEHAERGVIAIEYRQDQSGHWVKTVDGWNLPE